MAMHAAPDARRDDDGLTYQQRHYRDNRDREAAAAAEWRVAHPYSPEERRAKHLRHRFGMSTDDYDALLAAQGGVCAICGQPPAPGTLLTVDHDHRSRAVRGLLCRDCNLALGLVDDQRSTLLAAVAYLDNPPAAGVPMVGTGDRPRGRRKPGV